MTLSRARFSFWHVTALTAFALLSPVGLFGQATTFGNIVGRVVTVNYNGKAVIDFQDGGWYDITASADCLQKVDPAEGKTKYKNINSAQPLPDKQG